MFNSKLRALLLPATTALALLGVATGAASQGLPSLAAHQKITRIEQVWRVNADATSVLEVTLEQEALSDQGAMTIGKAVKAYNSELEKLELLEAFTLKADGRKIPVGPEAVQIQKGVAAMGTNASWPGMDIHLITFADVQKGDRTVLSSRLSSLKPQLPGWARFADFMLPIMAIERGSIRIEAARSLQLAVSASGLNLVESRSGDTDIWSASFDLNANGIDTGAINISSSVPHIFASTVKDHGQLVALYAAQQQRAVLPTDEVKKLASQIAQGAGTPTEKSKAVFDWVRRNIRYVAVYLGAGGYVAHDTDWILKNRYGDCKDHVLLLQSLLQALGIEAVPALINTTAEYAVASLPMSYNHVIAYLPDQKLFLDPTESRTPFGALPYADADKPVAVALREGGRLMRTPAFEAQANSVLIKTVLKLDATGKAKGSVNVDARGNLATNVQNRLEQIPAGGGAAALRGILQSGNLRGRGSLQFPAVQRDLQVQSFSAELEIDNLLDDPQSGSVNPHPALNFPIYALNNMGNYSADRRRHAYPCTPGSVREEFELGFDKAYKILRIPEGVTIDHPDGVRFESQYSRIDGPDGTRIKGYRQMTLSHPRHVCSAEDYAARRMVFNRIARNLRTGVLFEQP